MTNPPVPASTHANAAPLPDDELTFDSLLGEFMVDEPVPSRATRPARSRATRSAAPARRGAVRSFVAGNAALLLRIVAGVFLLGGTVVLVVVALSR